MRELKRATNELELGLELELESDDVAAAVAAVAAEAEGQIPCSCCNELLDNAEQLHQHQMNQHTIIELSLALITLRGFDIPLMNHTLDDCAKDVEDAGNLRSLLDTVQERIHESDSESTITVSSEARMAMMESLTSPLTFPDYDSPNRKSSLMPNGPSYPILEPEYLWNPDAFLESHCYENNNFMSNSYSTNPLVDCSEVNLHGDPMMWSDINGNTFKPPDNCKESTLIEYGTVKDQMYQNAEPRSFMDALSYGYCKDVSPRDGLGKSAKFSFSGRKGNSRLDAAAPKHLLCKRLSAVRKPKRHTSIANIKPSEASDAAILRRDVLEAGQPTCSASPYKVPGSIERSFSNDTDGRQFFCDSCGRGYKKKSHLERHLRVHTGVRPYPCTMCDKRFAVRSILNQHLRVHTGERPYSCSVCMQRFPQKSGLMTHMMLHNGKPFKCEYCIKSFVSNHKLMLHRRSHTDIGEGVPTVGPHKCSDCELRFFTPGALMDHRKVHVPMIRPTSAIRNPMNELVMITEEAARAAVAVVGKYNEEKSHELVKTEVDDVDFPEEKPNLQDTANSVAYSKCNDQPYVDQFVYVKCETFES